MMTKSRAVLGVTMLALSAGAAHAESKTLYVGMNGGNFERTFTQAVFPEFERDNDVKIVVVPGTSSEILAKTMAAKDRPQMHLMFLDDGVMVRAVGLGLCENTTAKAPTPEAEQKLNAFQGYMTNAVTLDWDLINAKRPEWNSRWNRMIER